MKISTIYQIRQTQDGADTYWIIRIVKNQSSQTAQTVYVTRNIKKLFDLPISELNKQLQSKYGTFTPAFAPTLIAQAETVDKLRYKIPWLLL